MYRRNGELSRMSCELWIFNITFIVVKDDRSGPKGQGDVAQGFGVSENGEYRRKCHISIGKLMVNHRNLRFSQHFLAPKPCQLQVSCGALPEVAFGLLLLGTLNYNFVELIAATVIFDCVWSPGAFRVSTWLL